MELGDVLKCSTDALQAVERLYLSTKKSKTQYSEKCLNDIRDVLDKLRSVKSEIDGSDDDFIPMTVNQSPMQELRQLVLMHVPNSLNEAAKERITSLLMQIFEGKCQKLLGCVLLACPWYTATQRERGEQARYNILFTVYMSKDRHFFAPVNPHFREENDVVDLNWLYAAEMYHFSSSLCKGKIRCVEAVFSHPNAVIYETDEWKSLREGLSFRIITGLRGYLEACRGQAIGAVAKKNKAGKMRLRETTTFFNLCESFRLLQHFHHVLKHSPPATADLIIDDLPDEAKQGVSLLKDLYLDPEVSKKDIFEVVMNWKKLLDGEMKSFKFTSPQDVHDIVGKWMMRTRLQGRTLDLKGSVFNPRDENSPSIPRIEDDFSQLSKLMETIGEPIAQMKPEQIILIVRAGSYLYGLSTKESDVDYVIIYAEPTKSILSTCKQITECRESRGPEKDFEFGAYEARLFCEMILKCSVVILELIFADNLDYMSSAWKDLQAGKAKFVTEKTIQQYLGLIKNNFNMIDSKKHIGTRRDRKLFYQIFHKLDSLDYMLKGQPPPVRCQGIVQEFIMKIRTEPLEGDFEREKLHSLALQKYEKFCSDHACQNTRLPENPDYLFVTDWLMSLRGSYKS